MSLKGKIKNFFSFEDGYEYEEEVRMKEVDTQEPQGQKGENVVSLSAIQQSAAKVVLCEPQNYDEVQEIADNLLNKRAVVINLQRIDQYQAKRIVDFLSGTVYAVKGDIQKLGMQTFLCTPETVDVSGTISNPMYEEDEFEKGW